MPDLAVETALFRVIPRRRDVKCTCKPGKRAGRGPAQSLTGVLDKEAKGQIDHILFAGLSTPSFTLVLGQISGVHDVFKRGQDFVDLNSVTINRTEGLRAPERDPGGRVSTQPVNSSS